MVKANTKLKTNKTAALCARSEKNRRKALKSCKDKIPQSIGFETGVREKVSRGRQNIRQFLECRLKVCSCLFRNDLLMNYLNELSADLPFLFYLSAITLNFLFASR